MDEQVLHLHQPREVDAAAASAPAGGVEQLPAAKAKCALLDLLLLALRA